MVIPISNSIKKPPKFIPTLRTDVKSLRLKRRKSAYCLSKNDHFYLNPIASPKIFNNNFSLYNQLDVTALFTLYEGNNFI